MKRKAESLANKMKTKSVREVRRNARGYRNQEKGKRKI